MKWRSTILDDFTFFTQQPTGCIQVKALEYMVSSANSGYTDAEVVMGYLYLDGDRSRAGLPYGKEMVREDSGQRR